MRRIVLVILFFSSNLVFSQKIYGVYQDTCCEKDHFLQLHLKKNKKFIYNYSFELGSISAKGRWRFKNDTLQLEFVYSVNEIDSITYSNNPDIHPDSLMIEIVDDDFSSTDLAYSLILNEDCDNPVRLNYNGRVVLEKQMVNSLRVEYQTCKITSKKFNHIKLKVNSMAFMLSPRLNNIEKWIFKNDELFLISCNATDPKRPWIKQ